MSKHDDSMDYEQTQAFESNATREEIDLAKKGKSLTELLVLMDEYSPVIPDSVTDYYLARSGFDCNDQRVKRLLGLAAQKFISDIATDALQYSKLRQQSSSTKERSGKNPGKEKRAVMHMEDLASALADHGINAKRPEYFM